MIEYHGPTTIAVAHAGRPAVLLAEECLGVAQEEDIVTLDAIDLAPRVHDPGVVGRNCGHDIDALVAELAALLDVGREVVGLAAGCEGTWNTN